MLGEKLQQNLPYFWNRGNPNTSFFPFELLFYFRFVFIVDNAMVSVKSEVAQNDKCKENIGSKNTTYFLKDILFPGFFHRANLMKLLGV